MSKVVRALNVMLANPDKITDVTPGQEGNEKFFLYDGKHKWSLILLKDGKMTAVYYPEPWTIRDLSQLRTWDGVQMVTYPSEQVGGREALETYRELYTLLTEKELGMDAVFDDILKDDLPDISY